MLQIEKFLTANFWLLYGIAVAWLLCWSLGSAVFRKSRKKPFFADPLVDANFTEKWASGRSLKNVISRLGGARNVLLISVSKKELSIIPHFPFSLMFLPEIYDLEYRVPLSQVKISDAESSKADHVNIEITPSDRDSRLIELKLRDKSGFLTAVNGR